MIKIKTKYCAETSTRPERIKVWVLGKNSDGSRNFATVAYNHRLAGEYGREAAYREAATHLATRSRLGTVSREARMTDNGYVFTVLDEPDDQTDQDNHQDRDQ